MSPLFLVPLNQASLELSVPPALNGGIPRKSAVGQAVMDNVSSVVLLYIEACKCAWEGVSGSICVGEVLLCQSVSLAFIAWTRYNIYIIPYMSMTACRCHTGDRNNSSNARLTTPDHYLALVWNSTSPLFNVPPQSICPPVFPPNLCFCWDKFQKEEAWCTIVCCILDADDIMRQYIANTL